MSTALRINSKAQSSHSSSISDSSSSKNYSSSEDAPIEKRIYTTGVILLGDIAVGKTALFSNFIDGKETKGYKATISVEYKTKEIALDKKTSVKMSIWDTSGGEQFRALTRNYFRSADGVLLLFDITQIISFYDLPEWIKEINDYAPKDVKVIIVGNKLDLDAERTVSMEEASKFAKERNMMYLEISAKKGTNVSLLFETIAQQMIQGIQNSNDEEEEKKSSIVFSYLKDKKSIQEEKVRNCC